MKKSIRQLAIEHNIKYATLFNRIKYKGMTLEEAVKLPVKQQKVSEKVSEAQRKRRGKNTAHVSRLTGVRYLTLCHRMRTLKISAEEAARIPFKNFTDPELVEASEKYNVRIPTIRSHMRKKNISADEAARLIANKMTVKQIEEKYNINIQRVYKCMHRLGISRDEAIQYLIDKNNNIPRSNNMRQTNRQTNKQTIKQTFIDAGIPEDKYGSVYSYCSYNQCSIEQGIEHYFNKKKTMRELMMDHGVDLMYYTRVSKIKNVNKVSVEEAIEILKKQLKNKKK